MKDNIWDDIDYLYKHGLTDIATRLRVHLLLQEEKINTALKIIDVLQKVKNERTDEKA